MSNTSRSAVIGPGPRLKPDPRPLLVETADVRRQSKAALALFAVYSRWYMRKHFHGVRIAHAERFIIDSSIGPSDDPVPVVVYLNHPSWWDPLTCITVYRALMPGSFHYAPMEEASLQQYGFFKKIGLFPVELGTTRGAAQFLRGCRTVLQARHCTLWITPHGKFTDPRQRPVRFMPGMGLLAHRTPRCVVLPLAFEYTHWDERLPEALINCGHPIRIERGPEKSSEEWTSIFERAMEATQDELAALSFTRDPSRFHTLLSGGRGTGGIYELWQRLRARLQGKPYYSEHGSIRHNSASTSTRQP